MYYDKKLSPAQLASLASSLGRKHGITVDFGDFETASTNGEKIVLPLTSRDNSWIIRGYLDHEIGHVRLSDFQNIPNSTPFLKTLWNVIEDIRIEKKMAELYPGMRSNYRGLIRELLQEKSGIFQVADDTDPDGIIAGFISLHLRSGYLGQAELSEPARQAQEVFQKVFGDKLLGELKTLLDKMANVASPGDVINLVEEIIDLLKKQNDSSENPSDSSNKHEDKQEQNDSESAAQELLTQALESSEEKGDFGEQLKALAQQAESGNTQGYQPPRIGYLVGKEQLYEHGYTAVPVAASTQIVSELSAKLQGLLQAQKLSGCRPAYAGNRLDRNRLHRVRTGDPKVFQKKSPEQKVNTAVHLLIDNSGSMRTSERFAITQSVSLALVKTLTNVRGVNLGVSIFPGFSPYSEDGIPVATVLSHGQRSGSTMQWPSRPKGDTPLAESVRLVLSNMVNLQETRKILMVLTDGQPNSDEDARVAIDEANDLGVEVVALGIEGMENPSLFNRFEMVENVNQLPEKTFKLLEQLITK